MLSSLYQFAHFAYVGGGFGKGLHNILEPLGFGIPVIFGNPRSASKFPEAAQSQLEGCGFAVSSFSELQECVTKLEQPEFYKKSAASSQHWVEANLGAADLILDHLTTSISSK